MHITVRAATYEDLDWLCGQLKEFARTYSTEHCLYGSEETVRGRLRFFIDGHVLLIAEREGFGPVGLIGGVVTPHLFNPDIRLLAEMFWWVDEAHRGTRAGLMLLNAFTDWGKTHADWITFSLETHSPVKVETLVKRGFKVKETGFLYEVLP